MIKTPTETLIGKCATLPVSAKTDELLVACDALVQGFEQDFLDCLANVREGNGMQMNSVAKDGNDKLQQIARSHRLPLLEEGVSPPKASRDILKILAERKEQYATLLATFLENNPDTITKQNGKAQISEKIRRAHSSATAVAALMPQLKDTDFELAKGIRMHDPKPEQE